ncbi:hypothetical protein LBMAG15_08950 [Actinomycetes bacterium]|nr:hypothetical protein LBMAG15_08950 [Actinomycetes bacterium]
MPAGGHLTNHLPTKHRVARIEFGAHRFVGGSKPPVPNRDDRPPGDQAGKKDGAGPDGSHLLAGFGG